MSLPVPICIFPGGSIPDGVSFIYVRTTRPNELLDIYLTEAYGNRTYMFTEQTDSDGIATLDLLEDDYKASINAFKGTFQVTMKAAGTNSPATFAVSESGETVQYDALEFDVRILNPQQTTVFIGPVDSAALPPAVDGIIDFNNL